MTETEEIGMTTQIIEKRNIFLKKETGNVQMKNAGIKISQNELNAICVRHQGQLIEQETHHGLDQDPVLILDPNTEIEIRGIIEKGKFVDQNGQDQDQILD